MTITHYGLWRSKRASRLPRAEPGKKSSAATTSDSNIWIHRRTCTRMVTSRALSPADRRCQLLAPRGTETAETTGRSNATVTMWVGTYTARQSSSLSIGTPVCTYSATNNPNILSTTAGGVPSSVTLRWAASEAKLEMAPYGLFTLDSSSLMLRRIARSIDCLSLSLTHVFNFRLIIILIKNAKFLEVKVKLYLLRKALLQYSYRTLDELCTCQHGYNSFDQLFRRDKSFLPWNYTANNSVCNPGGIKTCPHTFGICSQGR